MRFALAQAPSATRSNGIGQRAEPLANRGAGSRSLAQDRQRSVARGVLEGLFEFGKADLDEPGQALADIGVVTHQPHAEARRLPDLGAD